MSFANTSLTLTEQLTNENSTLGLSTTGPLPEVTSLSLDTLQQWIQPSIYIDDLLLDVLASINLKKQQIVDICSLASAGDPTACTLSETEAGVTSVYSSIAVGIATTAGNYVGLAVTDIVGYGIINADTLIAFQYPNLETGNYSADNPIENGSNVTVTSSNAGIGKVNTFTQNNGSQLGYAFAITGGGGSCAGWASSITSLISEIASIRNGITTYIDAANYIKEYKYKSQLNYWSLNKVISLTGSNISANQTVLTILNNPDYGGPY